MTDSWGEDTVRRVAAEVKRYRKEVEKLSVAKLAERTAELGFPISVNAITDLELGRRSRLEVTELLILGAALDVPPGQLLFPDLPNGRVEAIPGRRTLSILALRWIAGLSMPPTPANTTNGPGLRESIIRNRRRAELSHQLHEARGARWDTGEELAEFDGPESSHELLALREALAWHDRRVQELRDQLRQLGATLGGEKDA
ncbi:hypothetical protein G6009_05530 [Dietzia sp. SLG510A3-30A2]|nr:hypothetical protein [Dietzia sp. SLG510A3-30A2]